MDTKHRYDIKNFKNAVINDIQRKYPSLPSYWVAAQDELVNQIAQYSPGRCVELMSVCGDAITILLGKDPFLEDKITIELNFKKVVQETVIFLNVPF